MAEQREASLTIPGSDMSSTDTDDMDFDPEEGTEDEDEETDLEAHLLERLIADHAVLVEDGDDDDEELDREDGEDGEEHSGNNAIRSQANDSR